MATLSGQTIQSTYKGLLKLANSTSGITSSYQSIEDGLGNDTGIKIKNNNILDTAHLSTIHFKPKSLGTALGNAAQGIIPAIQNYLVGQLFWDNGKYSYSSITLTVRTATTTSDIVTAAFYSSQMTPNGLLPKDLILSGITIPVTTTGQTTINFSSPLTFSDSPGLYYFMYKVSNSGVTPTYRFSIPSSNIFNQQIMEMHGLNGFWNTSYATLPANGLTGNSNFTFGFSGLTNFSTSYTSSQIVSAQTTNLANMPNTGFLLNVI